jgi:hypothetical protein
MGQAKHSPSRPKCRRWMKFTESQLVLATLANGRTTNTKRTSTRTSREVVETRIGEHEPALITPSPSSRRNKNRKISNTSKRRTPKKLFRRLTTAQHVIQTEEQDQGNGERSTPRRLFDDNVRANDRPDLPTPKRSNKSRRTLVQSKRISTSWDSLASVSSVATKVSLTTTTTTENGTTKTRKTITREEESSHESIPTPAPPKIFAPTASLAPRPRSSLIPPNLLSVLAPIGFSRKPRTSSQILEEEAKASQSTLLSRQRLPRACKDQKKHQHYSEESEDEEEKFPQLPGRDNGVVSAGKQATQMAIAVSDSRSSPPRSSASSGLPPLESSPRVRSRRRITNEDRKKTKESPVKSSKKTLTKKKVGSPKRHEDRYETQSYRKQTASGESVEQQRIHHTRSTSKHHGNAPSRRESPPRRTYSKRHSSKEVSDRNARVAALPDKSELQEKAPGRRDSPPRRTGSKRHSSKEVSDRNARVAALADKSSESIQSNPQNKEDADTHSVPNTQPVVQVISESQRRKKHSKKKKAKKKKSKVRFAPLPTATTTFSVKIRVKTSMSPGASLSNNGQMTTQAPALSESTVQSIANQITQACLLQSQHNNAAPSNHLLENGSVTRQPANHAIENGNNNNKSDQTRENPFEVAVDCDTSVISDLTRERVRRQSFNDRTRPVAPPNEEDIESDNDRFQHDAAFPEYSDSVPDKDVDESTSRHQETPLPTGQSDSNRAASRQRRSRANNDEPYTSSNKRRRKTLTSSDSLAGSLAGYSHASSEMVTPIVPKEVSVNKSSARYLGENQQPRESSSNKSRRARRSLRKALPDIDETVVTDHSASPNARCGKCSGCRRSFDCMNCDNCLARLQAGEDEHGKSDCLGRICQLTKSYGQLDSLGMANQAVRPAPKNLQDNDDFSYLSEVEWKNQKPKPVKRLSRAARLWSRPGFIGKQKSPNTAGSISSVTTMTGMGAAAPAVCVPAAPRKAGGQARRKGKKKDPLHYMEMPMSTDGSVASWMEGRRSLRALMQYDEADQDWV